MSYSPKNFKEIFDVAKRGTRKTVSVAAADDVDVLSAIKDAQTQGKS